MDKTKTAIRGCLLAVLAISASSARSRAVATERIPAARVAWHAAGRAFLNPANGTGFVVGYFSFLEGVPGPLFNGTSSEATAFFTFRSDVFSLEPLPANGDVALVLVASGNLSLYFNSSPAGVWTNPDSFSSGELIATFSRHPGQLIQIGPASYDTFSAGLASSADFVFQGRIFNFSKLLPYGVTNTNVSSNTPLAGLTDFPVSFPFGSVAVAVGSKLSTLGRSVP